MLITESKHMFSNAKTIEECIDEVKEFLGFLQEIQTKGIELDHAEEGIMSVSTHVTSTASNDLFEWAEENNLEGELMEILDAIDYLILYEDFQVKEPLDTDSLKKKIKEYRDDEQVCLECLRELLRKSVINADESNQ